MSGCYDPLKMPRMSRSPRGRLDRHARLLPTAERAAALRLFMPIDHVRPNRATLAADYTRPPIEIDRAGALHDGFGGIWGRHTLFLVPEILKLELKLKSKASGLMHRLGFRMKVRPE